MCILNFIFWYIFSRKKFDLMPKYDQLYDGVITHVMLNFSFYQLHDA